MISGFFIDRPKFAIVIALVITLAGLLALRSIPISRYPNITPPQVTVSASDPGASAETIAKTVAEPIETQVNGVQNALYMSSTSTGAGDYTLTVTFAIGSDPNIDEVHVQNRVSLATAELPSAVSRQGLTVRKQSSNFVLAVNLYSPHGKFDQIYLTNYATIHVKNPLARIKGVGFAHILGSLDYAMRIWLDPAKMTGLGITASDVVTAISQQNLEASAGQIGESPISRRQQDQLTIVARGRLRTAAQFRRIIVRANKNGGIVRLGDIARVQLGAKEYKSFSKLDGRPSATVAIYEAPGANALAVAHAVQAKVAALAKHFPPGLKYAVAYNASRAVTANITEIVRTLAITFVLVVAVVFLFLQDWRATLIPTLAIPVSLIGVFAALYALGYTANTITLFAIVLSITLVVDDAIVVIENVTRNLEEKPDGAVADATRVAMREITGPVVATTLVLVAVFAPVGFLPGIGGQLFRQFAVTISVAVLISAVNALTLSPALCALILRPPKKAPWRVFAAFNRVLDKARNGYGRSVRWLGRRLWLGFGLIGLVLAACYLLFTILPPGFLPQDDQGYFFVNVQLPNGASLMRTQSVVDRLGTQLQRRAGVAHVIELAGHSLISGTSGPNSGAEIVILKPWGTRPPVQRIIARLQPRLDAIAAAQIKAFNPPVIPGLGGAAGFSFRLEGTNGQSPRQMAATARALIYAANQNKSLRSVFTTYSASMPEILIHVQRARAEMLGVSPGSIYSALQANLGSQYVNDFNLQGQVFHVMVQDAARFRNRIGDISRLYVRSASGAMVPMRSLVRVSTITGAYDVTRHNMFPSVNISGHAAAGESSGQAIAAMSQVSAKHLPSGYSYEWAGLSYQQQAAGSGMLAFAFALIFAYLFLVAQYESWSLPCSVVLSVSVAALGALGALWLRRISLNVYCEIGLVLLIGLAAKNAILIVEFAKTRLARGGSVREAAEAGARTRYRAVLMTAIAFIVGVIPLVTASGAGAAARRSIGTTVFGGMIFATFAGIVFVPVLFVGFELLGRRVSTLIHRGRRGETGVEPAE